MLIDAVMTRRAEVLADVVAPHLPPGPLLDVGCGTGHNARALSQRTGCAFTEVDVVDMKLVGPPPVLYTDRLPFSDGQFAAATLLFILHYLPDPRPLLQEVRRVSPGRLVVLQSTCTGPLSRRHLAIREWAQGRMSLSIARRLGLLHCDNPMIPAAFLTFERLYACLSQTGWRTTAHRSFRPRLGGPARELLVLEAA